MRHRVKALISELELLAFIPKGMQNAIHMRDLAVKLGITERSVRAAVKETREKGITICSLACGYWIPETKQEREVYVAMMDKQSKSRQVTIKHTKKELRKMPDQMELDTTEKDSGVK